MPGVFRPYTLTDVLMTINAQLGQQNQPATTVSGVGFIAEADESLTPVDSASGSVSTNAGWDQGVWGGVVWS